MICWQCNETLDPTVELCEACGALQPPRPDQTHFQRLDVPYTFAQDAAQLAQHHRTKQRALHPDRFVSRSDRERRFSLEHATALNDAYRVLRDPCRRADYMLSLRGVDITNEANQVKLTPMFLMEIVELREAIDELSGSDIHVERGRIEREVAHRYEDILGRLGDGLDGETEPTEGLAQYAAQLKYLKRILDELHALAS